MLCYETQVELLCANRSAETEHQQFQLHTRTFHENVKVEIHSPIVACKISLLLIENLESKFTHYLIIIQK